MKTKTLKINGQEIVAQENQTVLEAALENTDSAVKKSDKLAEQFAAGEDVPVHELMTSIARSDLSLRLTTIATTRAIAAYQEIARLQV